MRKGVWVTIYYIYNGVAQQSEVYIQNHFSGSNQTGNVALNFEYITLAKETKGEFIILLKHL